MLKNTPNDNATAHPARLMSLVTPCFGHVSLMQLRLHCMVRAGITEPKPWASDSVFAAGVHGQIDPNKKY